MRINSPWGEDEAKLLSLGLKFSPTMDKSTVAETSSRLEPTLKKLDPAIESAVTYDVTNNLMNSKSKKSNLSVTQQKALKSLKAKSKEVKILPADKGNAAVVMTNEQYNKKKWMNILVPIPIHCSKRIPPNLLLGNLTPY